MAKTLSHWVASGVFATAIAVAAFESSASQLVMKDGRIIQGRLAQIASVIEKPKEGVINAKTIVLVDDGLRRIYVPQRQVQEANELDAGDPIETFLVRQKTTEFGAGAGIAMVGGIKKVSPFDDYGRRIIVMETARGDEAIIQGITEITPEWTKLECIDCEGMHYVWDMRIATSSIPRDTLERVLSKRIDPTNLDQRLKVVRLYLQSDRHGEAEQELDAILRDFPSLSPANKQVFEQNKIRLRQAQARRILEEIELRKKSGQHQLCRSLLSKFPTENVAGETLQAVRELLDEYARLEARGKEVLNRLDEIIKEIKDPRLQRDVAAARSEINAELSLNTLDRMAAFMQFQADSTLPPDDRTALAVSGWLAGSDYAVRNLPVALSMYETRNLIRDYLAETSPVERDKLMQLLRKQEGFTPELTARILSTMKPPLPLPEPSKEVAGLYDLMVDDIPNQIPINYTVQLPREYDPHRHYPVIVTLHAGGITPLQQLEWWAGAVGNDGNRYGHADRNGFIVIAPEWAKPQQGSYNFSEDEHGAVLYALRDANRRLSIDTDRVFITGHSMGGDAAWDIALARPDLWAGFIGVAATADKMVTHYDENAAYVPIYLISGEKDGLQWVQNGNRIDSYLSKGYNATVVQFKGRGREHFSDEIMRLFDWMGRQKRDPFPRKFYCRSLRRDDGSFWWVETHDPMEKMVLDPDTWPPKGVIPNRTEAWVNATNGIIVKPQTSRAVVWLSPELIDFKRPTEIYIRGTRVNKAGAYIEPDVTLMLEDARTRSDRRHPFWAKVEFGGK